MSLSLLFLHCAISRMALQWNGMSVSESKFLVQYFMALFVLQHQFTALHRSSVGGSLPVVKALLDGGANVW